MKLSTAVKTTSLVLGIALSVFAITLVVFARVWVGPRQVPPGCTLGDPGCDYPLHTGTADQVKAGGLNIGRFLTVGSNLIVGNTAQITGRAGIGHRGISATEDRILAVGADLTNAFISVRSINNGDAGIIFGDGRGDHFGQVRYHNNNNSMTFWTNERERVRIDNRGWIGIGGVVPPDRFLTVRGPTPHADVHTAAFLADNGVGVGIGGLGVDTSGSIQAFNDNLGGTARFVNLIINNMGGNVGIGTPTPQERLHVVGNVRASAFFYGSDRSLKEEIKPLGNSLARIRTLEGVTYKWKESGEQSIGLIAQDVEKIFPEIVSTDNQGVKTIEYAKLVAPLIGAIQEQQAQIERQQKEIEELRNKIELKR